MFRVLIFLSFALCATFARADAIGKLKSFISSTRSGQASFTQELLDKNGKRLQFVSGTMQFVRPGKFRWVYQKPYEQVIVGDGAKFWLYDVDLNQVTVKKLDAALGGSPAALLAGSNEIEREFALHDVACDEASAPAAAANTAACGAHEHDGLEWLEAVPKIRDTSFETIRMAFNAESELVVMELRDSFGHNTVLHFSNMQHNPQLPSSLFKFTPPKGADVLGDE
jgi:outer membrane lipoprotein carrier protein